MWMILGHSEVVAKKSSQHMPGLEHGTLSWYAQPLATRPPSSLFIIFYILQILPPSLFIIVYILQIKIMFWLQMY